MPQPNRKHRVVATTLAALVLASSACSNDGQATMEPSSTTREEAEVDTRSRQPTLDGAISVLASDSFVEALPPLVARFQAINDGVEITVRYGPALDLAVELGDGIPADVFITDDDGSITAVVATGRVDGAPKAIASGVDTTVAVATISPSDNQMASRAFVDFLSSTEGLDVFGQHGFTPPA